MGTHLYALCRNFVCAIFLEQQGGACAVCGATDPSRLDGRSPWDLDHSGTQIRGVLCHGCNIQVSQYENSRSRVGSLRTTQIEDYLGKLQLALGPPDPASLPLAEKG